MHKSKDTTFLRILLAGVTLGSLKKYFKDNRSRMRDNPISRLLRVILGLLIAIFIFASETLAADDSDLYLDKISYDESCVKYTNPDTGYVVYIDDEAGLLTEDDESELTLAMQDITQYGNAAFVSNERGHNNSTAYFTEDWYQELFMWDSGTMFMIDMDNREIFIHSDGAVYKIVDNGHALTITDNAYKLASKGDFYGCADLVFGQELRVLQGERIAQPMKYTSNAVLAILLAMLVNFGLLILSRRAYSREVGSNELLRHALNTFKVGDSVENFKSQTKVYSPPSSGSSGGHSGGHSSGGHSGGGGGHHGGGGGHSF